ncbi:MAG: TylF/MycF/NovP-related O-methyltransferase [Anaerolineae bacterium]|nr:TylF/MycF/NovP-related O-methyltransferase [Anaerolineae bacterium]
MTRRIGQKLQTATLLTRQLLLQPKATLVALRVWSLGLSMLGLRSLLELQEAVADVEVRRVPGAFVEAGVGMGGSAIVIAAARRTLRPVYLYDTFEGIPAPSEADGAAAQQRYELIQSGQAKGRRGQPYYGYNKNLQAAVEQSLQRFGLPPAQSHIYLVKGLYQDALHPPSAIAFAHLDCDWYESVRVCLERVTPALSLGGVLVVDDYDYWLGCRRAVDEFFASRRDQFLFVRRGRLHIVRQQ